MLTLNDEIMFLVFRWHTFFGLISELNTKSDSHSDAMLGRVIFYQDNQK